MLFYLQVMCKICLAAAPIFAWLGICGSVPIESVPLERVGPVQAVYNGISSGRSLASVCLLYVERLV